MESPETERVRLRAQRLLQTNLRQGHDHDLNFDYSYLCPSPHEYRWRWFWDSCFHAIALAHVEPEQAKREIDTLFATQREDGFIGHMYYWGVRMGGLTRPWAYGQSRPGEKLRGSALIQPPMIAQAVERVGEVLHDPMFAPGYMRRLDAYHNWLATNRVPDDDGLLVIVSPYESGTDQSPVFDQAMGFEGKPGRWTMGLKDRWLDARNWLDGYDSRKIIEKGRFRFKESLVNGLYVDSLETMARLHRTHGNFKSAEGYKALATRVTESMLDKLLDCSIGGFMSIAGPTERRVGPITVGAIVPLVIRQLPEDVACGIIEHHVLRQDKFSLRYPLPSVAASEPTFDPREAHLIWRGPTWVNTNWLVWRGLQRHGHHDTAKQLAGRTISMVAEHGLWEFYNPLSGKGMGARDFGWSALALDMAWDSRQLVGEVEQSRGAGLATL
jgi:glycogen debranching enzyme